MHQFTTVFKEGATTVFDNMHPDGIPLETYIKEIGGRMAGAAEEIGGAELILKYTKKIDD